MRLSGSPRIFSELFGIGIGIVVSAVGCEGAILDLDGGNCWHLDALSRDDGTAPAALLNDAIHKLINNVECT